MKMTTKKWRKLSKWISFLFWRCPHCDKGFPIQHTRLDKMEICPFCGTKVE